MFMQDYGGGGSTDPATVKKKLVPQRTFYIFSHIV